MAAKLVGPKDRLTTKMKSKRFVINRSNGSGSDQISGARWIGRSFGTGAATRRLFK